MGRKILFITTDQQRFDALGCNGGLIARTPNIDSLAATGINYNRAHPQNVVCMPSRSTMITGQHVATHGVWMNGVPLPNDAPSVATTLHDADKVLIDRAENRHSAFGLGIHRCLGSNLARLELTIAIEEFIDRFPSFTLGGTEDDVTWSVGQIRGPRELPVQVLAK